MFLFHNLRFFNYDKVLSNGFDNIETCDHIPDNDMVMVT